MARLGDICRFQSGGTPRKSNPEFFGGDIPWITTVALNGGKIDGRDAVDWITDVAIRKSATKVIPRDSILVGTRVGIGKVAINSIPMATNQDVIALTGVDTTIWDKNFLCKFIQSKSDFLISQSRGATIRGIKIETLSCIQVPNIPICEQRRIAAVLDKVSDLIAKRRQQLEKLDELVKARFVEMFGDPEKNPKGWRVLPMSGICSVGSSKRIYQSEQTSDGIPFWRISDLTDVIFTGTVSPKLYIPEDRYEELKEQGQVPAPGDILLTSRGTLGQCYIVKKGDKFYFQDGMISWLSKYTNDVTPLYILWLFAMSGFRKQIDTMQTGSTVAYLSIAMIKQLKIMLPPLELQNRFVSFVQHVEKTKTGIIHGLERLEALKRALMQCYFG